MLAWLVKSLEKFAIRSSNASLTENINRQTGEVWREVPSKVIFLDFDGVLHRKMTGTFEHLPAFERWLAGNPHVGIVISSSWRMESQAYLEQIFSADLLDRIVGRTAPEGIYHNRQEEIEAWAATNGLRSFVALDDDTCEFSAGCPFVIFTNFSIGLTQAQFSDLNHWENTSPISMPDTIYLGREVAHA